MLESRHVVRENFDGRTRLHPLTSIVSLIGRHIPEQFFCFLRYDVYESFLEHLPALIVQFRCGVSELGTRKLSSLSITHDVFDIV